MTLISKIRKVQQALSPYKPLVWVEVSKSAIIHNYKVFKNLAEPAGLAPVIKSNAYGHGLTNIAALLEPELPSFFAIDSLREALLLRGAGIKTKVLVMGFVNIENINNYKLKDVSIAITGLDQLREIASLLKHTQTFQIKLDTGLHRQGLLRNELPTAFKIIDMNPKIQIEGAFSHLADADSEDSVHAKKQIEEWNSGLAELEAHFGKLTYTHLAATAGSHYSGINANTLRLGIGLYGIDDPAEGSTLGLKPALELKTFITSLRDLQPGEFVGYNITFKAERLTKVATLPLGYNEGVDRRASNNGFVKIRDYLCPIIGRVSMNMISVDVTDVPEVAIEEIATVISGKSKDPNSVVNTASLLGTIQREVLVRIPAHLRRTMVK
ncbi:MAG TPA: alanine racemase [Patescibacteria group bacterium]|nr:alanine racemase [Patescibacteria group bacterium]